MVRPIRRRRAALLLEAVIEPNRKGSSYERSSYKKGTDSQMIETHNQILVKVDWYAYRKDKKIIINTYCLGESNKLPFQITLTSHKNYRNTFDRIRRHDIFGVGKIETHESRSGISQSRR